MSARDEALDLLEKILPREHAKAYRELFSKRFDAYAHELAEQQREYCYYVGIPVGPLPDLIDPQVDTGAGPVRPDE